MSLFLYNVAADEQRSAAENLFDDAECLLQPLVRPPAGGQADARSAAEQSVRHHFPSMASVHLFIVLNVGVSRSSGRCFCIALRSAGFKFFGS